jgi:hypothetical protein
MSAYKPPPFPANGATPESIAVAGTVLTRRLNTALQQAGGQVGAGRIVDGDTFISSTDTYIGADCSANPVTLTLPRQSEYAAMIVEVEQYAAGNTFTVQTRGSDTIDGAASITVTVLTKIRAISNGLWHAMVVG